MAFWSVPFFVLRCTGTVSDIDFPPALPLLYYLLHEPLGYRLSVPHVPWLVGYAFELRKLMKTLETNVADTAMGIALIYQTSQPDSSLWNAVAIKFGLPYFSISITLNILLTLMIVIRLVLHIRGSKTATGLTEIGGSCKVIATMLIESSTLYAVTSLLFIGPWGAGSHAADSFSGPLCQIQVRAFSHPDLRTGCLI